MPFELLDAILIGIMLVSGLLALLRGFTREVLSIVAWAGAALAAYLAYPTFKEMVRGYIQPDYVADIALVAGIFLGVLLIISLITMRVSEWILDSGVGPLDRTLGLGFGALRGLLLVVVAYLFFIWLVPLDQRPDWVRNAWSLPIIEDTGRFIISFLPPDTAETLLENIYPPEGAAEATTDTRTESPRNADSDNNEGYMNMERRELDRLLERGIE